MNFGFYTLTLIMQLIGSDGNVEIHQQTVHSVQFVTLESCEFTGEEWVLEVIKDTPSNQNWLAKWKCSPGLISVR